MADKIGREFGRLSGKDHYQVKYPDGDYFTYGIARMYGDSKSFNKYAAKGQIVVDHAVFPRAVVVDESKLIDIPHTSNYPGMDSLGYWWGRNEYDDYVVLQQILHDIIDDRTPDGCNVGRGFQMGVADGYAHYVVTKVARVNVTVEWRGFCLDRYFDRMLGYGGQFRKRDIEPFCRKFSFIGSHREKDIPAERVKKLPEYLEGYKTKYGFVPADVQSVVSSL